MALFAGMIATPMIGCLVSISSFKLGARDTLEWSVFHGPSSHFVCFFVYSPSPYRSVAPVVQLAKPRNLLALGREFESRCSHTNCDFSSQKTKNKYMPSKWRTINSLVHRIRLNGRRGKGTAESFSREKSRQAPQKEGG